MNKTIKNPPSSMKCSHWFRAALTLDPWPSSPKLPGQSSGFNPNIEATVSESFSQKGCPRTFQLYQLTDTKINYQKKTHAHPFLISVPFLLPHLPLVASSFASSLPRESPAWPPGAAWSHAPSRPAWDSCTSVRRVHEICRSFDLLVCDMSSCRWHGHMYAIIVCKKHALWMRLA